MSEDLEIGVVYERNGTYALAVDSDLLVTWYDDDFVLVKVEEPWLPARQMTCAQLCRIWGASVETLDELSREFLMPESCRDAVPSERNMRQVRHALTRGILRFAS